MASKLVRNFNCFYHESIKLNRFLHYNWVLQRQCTYCVNLGNSHEKLTRFQVHNNGGYKRNGVLLAFVTTCCFLFCGLKDKLKKHTSLFPVVHAIEKTQSGLRKRFNFIADIVEKSAGAVVCIESRILLRDGIQNVVPAGSGFIVKDDGLILTNAHVVVNRANTILQVKLKDGRVFTGQIEDVDMAADLATVRIKAKNLPVMKLGSSSDLRTGEWVVAIGSPLSLTDSVSAGVVSSPRRKGEDLGINFKDMQYIQTDAAITFGNSGGPLVNLDGEAVGVNSLKVTSGISFAIPIEYAKEFLKRSEENRKNEKDANESGQKRGYVGVSMLTLTPDLVRELNHKNYNIPEFLVNRILILQVMKGSPAFNSGLQPGDVIAEINGEPTNGVRSVYKALSLGEFLKMKIFRGDIALDVVIAPEQII